MISGITGQPLEAHIFMGVVYYQRLRHMVADKYQVCFLCLKKIIPIMHKSYKWAIAVRNISMSVYQFSWWESVL